MTSAAEGTAVGQRMVRDLLAAHRPLRSDVVALRDGLERLEAATTRPEDIEQLLGGLTVADLAWQLRAGCQFYCAHLDAHHSFEDNAMLPVMKREFPELTGQIKRLRREHEEVKVLIVGIRAAARQIDPGQPPTVHRALELVAELTRHLEAHLDFEEEALFPYFLRMETDWHYG